MKTTKFNVTRYIGDNKEKADKLINTILFKKQRSLMIAPMACGKTTFVMEDLREALKERGILQVNIFPATAIMEMVSNKYKVNMCKEKVKPIFSDGVINTTPESLPKVIEAIEIMKKEFFITYDEIHLAISHCMFRKAVYESLKMYDHELCYGLLGFTATPEYIMIDSRWSESNWNHIIEVKPSIKFKQSTKNYV